MHHFLQLSWLFTSNWQTAIDDQIKVYLLDRLHHHRCREMQAKFYWEVKSYYGTVCDRVQLQVSFSIALSRLVLIPVWPFPGDLACGGIPAPPSQIRLSGGYSHSDASFTRSQWHKPCLLDHSWDPASGFKTAVPVFTLLAYCNLRNSRFVKLQQVCSKHSLTHLSAVDCAVGLYNIFLDALDLVLHKQNTEEYWFTIDALTVFLNICTVMVW